MMVMPVVSGAVVPKQVRLMLALTLTILIGPVLSVRTTVELMSIAGLLLITQEVLVGIAMGFAVQLVFDAIARGGHVCDEQSRNCR